jgi:hypothetical protein
VSVEVKSIPCPAIALVAVREVLARVEDERNTVLRLAREASNVPEGNWALDVQAGVWTPAPKRKTDDINAELVEP